MSTAIHWMLVIPGSHRQRETFNEIKGRAFEPCGPLMPGGSSLLNPFRPGETWANLASIGWHRWLIEVDRARHGDGDRRA